MELVVNNLACARGGITVLDGVSFTLRAGQALVIRGANGIGKTTLLRTLARLQPARRGSITMPPDSVTYAAHSDGLKAVLTVRENLEFWAAVHHVATADTAIAAMDLRDLADRRAADLSAGQKRRLGLARLLVTGCEIWLLDEPTVSLDAASVALFLQVLRGHLAAGGMALIASHIDLGLEQAAVLDLTPFRARRQGSRCGFDEVFA